MVQQSKKTYRKIDKIVKVLSNKNITAKQLKGEQKRK